MNGKITEDDWEVVKHRIEAMPSHIKLAIGGSESLSKDDLLFHVKKRDSIGKRVVQMQLNYLRFFKKEMVALANE